VPGFERRIAQPETVIPAHVFLFRFSKNKVALAEIEPLCLYSVAIHSKAWQFSGGQPFYRLRGLKPATRIPPQPSHTETPTHIETRTHNQCGDTTEKTQAPGNGCINTRNILSIEEVK